MLFYVFLPESVIHTFRTEPKPGITDDTMLVEEYLHQKCFIVPGDYKNLKVTTPEDIPLAETILGI